MKSFLLFLLVLPALLFAADPIEKHPEWDQQYSKLIREANDRTAIHDRSCRSSAGPPTKFQHPRRCLATLPARPII